MSHPGDPPVPDAARASAATVGASAASVTAERTPAAAVPTGLPGAWFRLRWPHLPQPCRLCGDWGLQGLCVRCMQRFATPRLRCPGCAAPLPSAAARRCGSCLRSPPLPCAAVAAVDYGFPWDRLIGAFKFQQQPELASLLAGLLAEAVVDAHRAWQAGSPPGVGGGTDGAPDAREAIAWPEAVLPVPLSAQRLRQRGYNQAWELAKATLRHPVLRAALPAPVLPMSPRHGLLRLHDTPAQTAQSSRSARLRNLGEAFWLPPAAAHALRGRHVALVDDVLTTGATAHAATLALLRGGVASVQLWVLARTPAPAEG